MKLKNVKKLLGDEVYPLWLENILEYNSAFLDLDNEEGGVVHLSGCNLIKLAFEWGYTAQGYWFWLNLNSEFISELPWMFCEDPLQNYPVKITRNLGTSVKTKEGLA